MDEDGWKQEEVGRRGGRQHVEEYCEVFEDVGEAETKKGSEGTQEIVEFAEVEVIQEKEIEWKTQEETQCEREGGELVSEQSRQVKPLEMFEFGSWEEATSKAGNARTATKCVID